MLSESITKEKKELLVREKAQKKVSRSQHVHDEIEGKYGSRCAEPYLIKGKWKDDGILE
jgi:hypothetical protein